MRTRLAGPRWQHDTSAIYVVQELSAHPDLSSEEIAARLDLSKEELMACYDVIQRDEELQRLVVRKSKAPRLTTEAADLLTQHPDYLTRALSGESVYPLILEFHPGQVCQCQCKFCFSYGWDYGEQVRGEKALTMDRVLEVFQECRQNGVEEVWFSGGKEPFINRLTPEYIRAANRMGFRTRVYSNGIALGREAQEAVLDCYQVRISVNGANPATYTTVQYPAVRGVHADGAFDKALANIASLVALKKERNSPVRIGMSQILQPDNCAEMAEFYALAHRLGVNTIHFRLEAMGMVRDFNARERENILSSIDYLEANKNGVGLDIRGVAEGEFESRLSQFLPGLRKPSLCRAGLLKRGMNPFGAVYNCEFSSHPRFRQDSAHLRLGSVKEDSMGEILRRNTGRYPRPCRLCQAHEYGLNLTLEKLERDLEWGIGIQMQPWYRKMKAS